MMRHTRLATHAMHSTTAPHPHHTPTLLPRHTPALPRHVHSSEVTLASEWLYSRWTAGDDNMAPAPALAATCRRPPDSSTSTGAAVCGCEVALCAARAVTFAIVAERAGCGA